ncbi:MAG: potassium transporter Kup [Dermatophilaceae bacterium]
MSGSRERGRPTRLAGSRTGDGSGSRTAVTVAALGVVFGDIGTSPLYAVQAVFNPAATRAVPVNPTAVYGVGSLIVWAVVIVVFVKYVALIMRADNDGEGGIMALVSLIVRDRRATGSQTKLIMLGIVGAALFFGDSLITPAISVLSAVQGMELVDPSLTSVVQPIAAVIIVALFAMQRAGTAVVGRLFGPIMLLWFAAIGLCGLRGVAADPGILRALSPTYAVAFFRAESLTAFLALGAVVLVVTGAEALYADLGHFGAPPIRRAWVWVVFPALVLNYLGQGSLLLRDPTAAGNPFFRLVPSAALLPMVVLATAATVIASQAVISGTYSLARQASRLGYLPRLEIRHTSAEDPGQVYVPVVNTVLMVGVLALVATFGSSARLAAAYGIAVTGTMLITGLLYFSRELHQRTHAKTQTIALLAVIVTVDLTFLAANVVKIPTGGWFPLAVAAVVFVVMANWHTGHARVERQRRSREGPIGRYVAGLEQMRPAVRRVPGLAVFLTRPGDTTAPALHAFVERIHALHEKVVIVTVEVDDVPRVPPSQQASVDAMGPPSAGIQRVRLRFGFNDPQSVPRALRHALGKRDLNGSADLEDATYFVSTTTLTVGASRGVTRLRQLLYIATSRFGIDPVRYYDLPLNRTVTIGSAMVLS